MVDLTPHTAFVRAVDWIDTVWPADKKAQDDYPKVIDSYYGWLCGWCPPRRVVLFRPFDRSPLTIITTTTKPTGAAVLPDGRAGLLHGLAHRLRRLLRLVPRPQGPSVIGVGACVLGNMYYACIN